MIKALEEVPKKGGDDTKYPKTVNRLANRN